MIRKNLAAGIALAALALVPMTTHAAAKTGHCVTPRTSYAVAEAELHTFSTAFSSVAGAEVDFTQHGDASCVIVRFSAAVTGSPSILVRAVLDPPSATGQLSLPDQVVYFVDGGFISQATSFDFVFPNVKPGQHKARIQWRVGGKSGSVFMYERSTIVHHR